MKVVVDSVVSAKDPSESIRASQESDRKRALAKVYALLLNLADETEDQPAVAETTISKEGIDEQSLVQLTLL